MSALGLKPKPEKPGPKQSKTPSGGETMLKTFLTMTCCTALIGACGEQMLPALQTDPLFKDVARKPAITNPETPEWIVRNDRPFAEWVEEMGQACEDHGCSP
jgi:hypothetical protein